VITLRSVRFKCCPSSLRNKKEETGRIVLSNESVVSLGFSLWVMVKPGSEKVSQRPLRNVPSVRSDGPRQLRDRECNKVSVRKGGGGGRGGKSAATSVKGRPVEAWTMFPDVVVVPIGRTCDVRELVRLMSIESQKFLDALRAKAPRVLSRSIDDSAPPA